MVSIRGAGNHVIDGVRSNSNNPNQSLQGRGCASMMNSSIFRAGLLRTNVRCFQRDDDVNARIRYPQDFVSMRTSRHHGGSEKSLVVPRLYFYATVDIPPDTELAWVYRVI